MMRLWFTRRCRSTKLHRRRDTGELIKVQCERERNHDDLHYWASDQWNNRSNPEE